MGNFIDQIKSTVVDYFAEVQELHCKKEPESEFCQNVESGSVEDWTKFAQSAVGKISHDYTTWRLGSYGVFYNKRALGVRPNQRSTDDAQIDHALKVLDQWEANRLNQQMKSDSTVAVSPNENDDVELTATLSNLSPEKFAKLKEVLGLNIQSLNRRFLSEGQIRRIEQEFFTAPASMAEALGWVERLEQLESAIPEAASQGISADLAYDVYGKAQRLLLGQLERFHPGPEHRSAYQELKYRAQVGKRAYDRFVQDRAGFIEKYPTIPQQDISPESPAFQSYVKSQRTNEHHVQLLGDEGFLYQRRLEGARPNQNKSQDAQVNQALDLLDRWEGDFFQAKLFPTEENQAKLEASRDGTAKALYGLSTAQLNDLKATLGHDGVNEITHHSLSHGFVANVAKKRPAQSIEEALAILEDFASQDPLAQALGESVILDRLFDFSYEEYVEIFARFATKPPRLSIQRNGVDLLKRHLLGED